MEPFKAQVGFAVATTPTSVIAADTNGDGIPDLVATDSGVSDVSVLIGNGNGTFRPESFITVGTTPQSVQAADLNGDGILDLVTANSGSTGSLSILLGNGNGTFKSQTTLAVSSAFSISIADVNGDGFPDLIAANANNSRTSVLLGNGNGTFEAQSTFAVSTGPLSTAVADVNGDGKPDLIVGNYSGGSVSILLGNSNGSFTGQIYATPAKLAFTQQPIDTYTGTSVGPVSVNIEDSGGNTVGDAGSTVTFTLTGGTFADGSTSAAVAAVNGVATFQQPADRRDRQLYARGDRQCVCQRHQ